MTTDVFTRFATLDPAAEPDAQPDWNAVDAVLLATIDGRATTVTTELKHQKTEPTRQRTWRSSWVGAVAFAVVILAGIAVIVATTNTDSDVVDVPAPPFGTPTEAADAWIYALNDGTAEDIHALMADDYIGFGIIGPTVAETDERIRWDRTMGISSYVLDACEETSPTSVTCQIAVTLPIAGLLTGVEQRVDLITVRIDADGYISSTSVHEGPDDGNLYDLDAEFGAWLDANSDLTPFELNPRADSNGQLEMSPEDAAETFLSLLEQFVDQRSGSQR
jgi:hypothetical protein